MRTATGAFLLLALPLAAAAAFQEKKERGKTPELTKKFVEHMEACSRELKALKADIDADKPEADLKKRLQTIREAQAKARAVKYRKDEEEAELLDNHFEIFELKITKDFVGATWDTKETKLALYDRLKAKCSVCHEECRK